MDPALQRLVEAGPPDAEVPVMLRLAGGTEDLPPGVRIVSRFGAFATARVQRRDVARIRESASVRSVKAPRLYRPELVRLAAEDVEPRATDARSPAPLPATGRGVVVGVVDWGLDFRHPAFRDAAGGSRVEALWDQTALTSAGTANRFGYGRIHPRAAIDAALQADDPIGALEYDPTVWDVGAGTHGTATTSVAAGSSWPGGIPGLAPAADIVFVNLRGAGPLGHSTAIAEAIDFIRETARGRPWVVNLSLGRCGGPHDGCTLLEQFMDAAVCASPGAVIVNSCGNYYSSGVHTTGRLLTGASAQIPVRVERGIVEVHEIDLWYPGSDRLVVGIAAPDGRARVLARPGAGAVLEIDGTPAARVIHRTDDPNNGNNEVVIRIQPDAPSGTWQLLIAAVDVADGRYHAWVEREALRPGLQARFAPTDTVVTTTTGTICNGRHNLAVGAYDAHDGDRPLTVFSSSGDTVDGRRKPDLIAAGEQVLAARSAGRDDHDAAAATRMSGTSLAAPSVTGTVACLLELLGRAPASRLRDLLLRTAERVEGEDEIRAGNGYLDPAAACALATSDRPRRRRRRKQQPTEGEMSMLTEAPSTITPDEARQRLGVSPRALFEVFVLNRRPDDRQRLEAIVEQVAGAGDRVDDDLQPGDLLVRGAMGEGHAMLAVLVTGELLDAAQARRDGLELEGSLAGRYAWVTEGGSLPRPADDRFARRICDRQRYLPADQVLLRLRDSSPAVAAPAPAPDGRIEAFDEAVNRHSPEYTRWYQAALNQIDGAGLVVDGIVGPLTRAAVRRYQARKGLAADGIVGPITERALIADGAGLPPGFDGPAPTPTIPVVPPAPGTAVRVRRDVTTLSSSELAALGAAINTLRASGRYHQYVVDHNSGVADAHRQPGFLPWHRQFILFFESELRSIDPLITLPYWNWSQDPGVVNGVPMWNAQMQQLCGGDGIVNSGAFAGWREIGPNGRETTRQLNREFGQATSTLPRPNDVNAAMRATDYDRPPFNEMVTGGFRNTLEGFVRGINLHNTVHIWIGGSMGPMTSPNDPCFFLHHCFIDKLWADWQALSPANRGYVPAVTTPTVTGNGQVNAWGIDDPVAVRGLGTSSPVTYRARATLDVASLHDHTGAAVSVQYA